MVFGFGSGSGTCDTATLEQIMTRIRQKQAQLDYLRSQEAVNPQEYERMKNQILQELEQDINALAQCLRTIPKDPNKLKQEILTVTMKPF